MQIEKIKQLQNIIDSSKNIVVLTGAGISTASGIPDIRSKNGAMYNEDLLKKYKYDYETIVSHSFFLYNTEEFFRYYKNEMVHKNAKPNIAHIYLKKLEQRKNVTIITQNIDGLHHEAGSKNIIEFHGTIYKNKCMKCGKEYSLEQIMKKEGVPHCDECNGIIKPEVVLFEEGINQDIIHDAIKATEQADLLLIIGSSLLVYPAAGIPNYFNGKNLVIINKDKTPLDNYATLLINDNIIDVFKNLN